MTVPAATEFSLTLLKNTMKQLSPMTRIGSLGLKVTYLARDP